MIKLKLFRLGFILLFLMAAEVNAETEIPTPDTVLQGLKKGHPRLMLTNERQAELQKQMAQDELLQKIQRDVIKQADRYLGREPVVYKKIGPRLLSVSRDCLNRVYACGLAYRLTGEKKYADKVRAEMLAVVKFKDWNPSHFLDTAEMSHAVGVGYDWIYDTLDETERGQIRAGLMEKGIKPALKGYFGDKPAWWSRSTYNWNQVCNSGMLIGALAIAESEPEAAGKIITEAVKSLPRAIKTYQPDGAWPESVGYWNYATSYTAYGLAALKTALGTDFGLSDDPGLALSGEFPLYGVGPTGLNVNFADVGENSRRRSISTLFWLGRRYNREDFIASELQAISKYGSNPWHFIWYPAKKPSKVEIFKKDKIFRGLTELAVMRNSWNDPQTVFVSVKGGSNSINHGHLDMGTFEIDALGVRWARDLGSDNYNLPGYWSSNEGGRRWSYYRLGSLSHNVPVIDGKNQKVRAKSKIVDFMSQPEQASVTVDLTEAYRDVAEKVQRRVALTDRRKSVVIDDTLVLKGKHQINWGMTTDAKIDIKGTEAILSLKGKKLRAKLLSPKGAVFSVESAEREPPEKANKGVRRLTVDLAEQNGKVRITVKFIPQTG